MSDEEKREAQIAANFRLVTIEIDKVKTRVIALEDHIAQQRLTLIGDVANRQKQYDEVQRKLAGVVASLNELLAQQGDP